MIPAWVLERVERALADGMTGFVRLNLRSGEIRHVEVEQVFQAPPSTSGTGLCLVCGRQMELIDYGNMYRCACGAKQTRTQMLQSARRAE